MSLSSNALPPSSTQKMSMSFQYVPWPKAIYKKYLQNTSQPKNTIVITDDTRKGHGRYCMQYRGGCSLCRFYMEAKGTASGGSSGMRFLVAKRLILRYLYLARLHLHSHTRCEREGERPLGIGNTSPLVGEGPAGHRHSPLKSHKTFC